MKHSTVVGGSSCARVIACPPSRLSAEGVRQEETQAMRDGNTLHAGMEAYVDGSNVVVPEELMGKFDSALNAWGELLEGSDSILHTNTELTLYMPPIPGAFGTMDVLLTHKANEVTVLDWKFGEGVQVFEDSPQLLFGAATAMTSDATRHVFNGETKIHLVIIQPNDRGLPVLRKRTTDVLEVFDFIRKLKWAVDNGHRDELLKSGEHCRFCPVKPVCPKLAEEAAALLQWNDPHDMPPEALSAALDQLEQIDMRTKAIRDYAHDRLNNAKPVPGWKLVARRARRQWKSESQTLVWANTAGVLPADLYDMKLRSPAQLEKKGDVPPELYESKSSGTTLARAEDKRPAVTSEAILVNAAERLRAINLKT